MELQLEKILLQILMVLFPIILYQAFQMNPRLEKRESFYWGIVFTVTIGLCVVYAGKIDEGIYFDLRMVPWFLAFIYGGNAVGLFVAAFYVVVRYLVGGDGMIPAFIVLILGTMVIWEFRNRYFKWNRKEKIFWSVLFIMVIASALPFLGVILINNSYTGSQFLFYIGFVLAHGLTIWLSVHLMESHREKQQLVKEIQKNEKLQVVGQVAASVAHEIRNPMTSVRGFIQILNSSKNLNDVEKNYLQICIEELDRANEIISDYLKLGKDQGSRDHGLIDVAELVNKSVNTLFSYANLNNVRLILGESNQAYVRGNSNRFQQMLVNLIKNAIEATAAGGDVHISVNIVNQYVMITVEDAGVGMTEEQIENLGLPFYSTKEKGTGLGLMVTLRIIQEMNGKWRIISTPNKGTTFEISFPLGKNRAKGTVKI